MFCRTLTLIVAGTIAGCASSVYTLESTADMSRTELAELCADLEIRSNQDCRWNIEQQQSSVQNQQTWEINCRSRRDFARDSLDNVCHPARFQDPNQGTEEDSAKE
jgi:hypothetical protein